MTGTSAISGAISGMDTAGWVDKLIEIEKQPITALQNQEKAANDRLTAWKAISAQLLNVKIQSMIVNRSMTFKETATTSSDEDVIKIASSAGAEPGTQNIKVVSLARAQNTLSRAVASKNSALMGSGTIELMTGIDADDHDVLGSTKLSTLNGGSGVDTSHSISVMDRTGRQTTISFDGAETVQDIIDTINNNSTLSLSASINEDGTGIAITDKSGGTGNLMITDTAGGTTAANLGIATNIWKDTVQGTDLKPKYSITIDSSNNTLEGIRDAINALDGPFSASIVNTGSAATPYKLSIVSKNTGTISKISFKETIAPVADALIGSGNGTKGSTAGDYSIASVNSLSDVTSVTVNGVSYAVKAVGAHSTDGSAGPEVEVDLNSGKLQFFNGGAAVNVTGDIKVSYTPGGLDLNGSLGLGKVAQEGVDAQIELGETSPETIYKHSNTIDDVISGVTLQLKKASDSTVTVASTRDIDGIKKSITDFVNAYNTMMTAIKAQGTYDAETKTKGGALFGDSTLMMIQSQMESAIMGDVPGQPSDMRSIFQIGVSSDLSGNLTIDDGELTKALNNRLDDVMNLFTKTSNVALSTLGGTASSSVATASGYSTAALTDGQTTSDDFDSGGGWMSDAAVSSANPAIINLNFSQSRTVSEFIVHTLDSTGKPASQYGIKDYKLQYLKAGGDASKEADWITEATVTNNTQGSITHYLSNVATTQVRLVITGTNATDGKARLVELEAKEDTGVGGQLNNSLASITDASGGLIAYVQDSINQEIKTYKERETQLNDRVEAKKEYLTDQFSRMEEALAKLQGMSSIISSLGSTTTVSSKTSSSSSSSSSGS